MATLLEVLREHIKASSASTLLVDPIGNAPPPGSGIIRLVDLGLDPADLWAVPEEDVAKFKLVVLSSPRTPRELFRIMTLADRFVDGDGTMLVLPYSLEGGQAEPRWEATELFLGLRLGGYTRSLIDANVVSMVKSGSSTAMTGEAKEAPPGGQYLSPEMVAEFADAASTGKRVISLSIFGDCRFGSDFWKPLPHYLANYVRAHLTLFPGYEIWIHHDNAMLHSNYGGPLHGLQEAGLVKLVHMAPDGLAIGKCRSMLWRLAPAWDPEVEFVFPRDVDSLPTWRERRATEQFLHAAQAHNLDVGTIWDSPMHDGIMGGLCAFRAESLRKLFPTFEAFVAAAGYSAEQWKEHGRDQDYLNQRIGPQLRRMEHQAFEAFAEDGVTRRYRKPSPGTAHFSADLEPFDDPAVPKSVQEASDRFVHYMGQAGYDNRAEVTRFYNEWCPEAKVIEQAETAALSTSSDNIAVFATDDCDTYSFFAPLTALAWKRLGYQSRIFFIGTPDHWYADAKRALILRKTREVGAEVHFTGDFQGVRSSTVAQVVRILGGSVRSADDPYLLTGDVDMWPLGPWVGGQRDPNASVQLYYANAYRDETEPHFPMCYVGMPSSSWRQVTEGTEGDLRGDLERLLSLAPSDSTEAWNFDERHLGRLLAKWEDFGRRQEIDRTFGPGQRRLDRSRWDLSILSYDHGIPTLAAMADSHLIRPGYTDDNWPRLLPLLDLILDGSVLDRAWAEAYRADFISLGGPR